MALQAGNSQPKMTYCHLATHKKKESTRDRKANYNVMHVTAFSYAALNLPPPYLSFCLKIAMIALCNQLSWEFTKQQSDGRMVWKITGEKTQGSDSYLRQVSLRISAPSISRRAAMHTEQLSPVRWEQHIACSIQTDSWVVLFWKRMARDYPDIKGAEGIIINMSV